MEFEDAKKFYEDLGKQKDEKEDDKFKYRILVDDYTQKESFYSIFPENEIFSIQKPRTPVMTSKTMLG